MQNYRVLNETGVVVEGSDAPHAVGEIIELDEASSVTQKWVETGVVEIVVEDQPAPEPEPVTDAPLPTDGPRVITQDDLDANPILTELNGAVGDTVSIVKAA